MTRGKYAKRSLKKQREHQQAETRRLRAQLTQELTAQRKAEDAAQHLDSLLDEITRLGQELADVTSEKRNALAEEIAALTSRLLALEATYRQGVTRRSKRIGKMEPLSGPPGLGRERAAIAFLEALHRARTGEDVVVRDGVHWSKALDTEAVIRIQKARRIR